MSETQAPAAREFNGVQIPAAATYVLDSNHKRIGFVARHLMVSKVRGEFAEGSATITVAENPLDSVVLGSGRCLEEFEALAPVLGSLNNRRRLSGRR